MTRAVPILTDAEVRRCDPAAEEAGFGALATAKGHLPLKDMDVQARIDGLSAELTLCQTYVNNLEEALEATYIFPLPDRAAVTSFRMEVAGRVIEGVLKERGAARRDYEEALQAGHRAAITEEERPGVFTLRVGNLMPGEEAKVRLTLVGPLPYSDGEATFRFPLVVAPRYIPGRPLSGPSVGEGVVPDTDAVPEASRITPPILLPGYPHPVRLSLAVAVHPAGLPLGEIRCSLHAVQTEEKGGRLRIALQPGERLNRDFILRFRVGTESVRTSLALHPDDAGEEGTFQLTLLPPAGKGHAQRPRDLVFVLDRSGSMAGWKMVAARRALARMVDTLTEQDRFNVYAFDNSIETPAEFQGAGLVPATDRQRFRAVEFLARIEARGGTEMAQPLDLAVRQLAGQSPESAPRDRILVLVTDGQVGNEDQILRTLGQSVKGLRIFALGIDQAVNEGFLRRLAMLGGGCTEVVESEDRLDEVMDKIHRRIATPVLTGLRLEPAGVEIMSGSLVPARMPDLFAGAPLLIMGRYRGRAGGSIALQARDAAGQPWSETVAATISGNPAVTKFWARGYVRDLEDRYVLATEDRSRLENQIVSMSLKFGALSRFTAFVAVDKSEVVNQGGQVHRIVQPVEPAAGWDMLELSQKLAVAGRGARYAVPPGARGGMAGMARRSFSPGIGGVENMAQGFAEAPVPVDLAAYRRRADELLEALKKSATADLPARLAALGILAAKLEALVDDLKSVGVPEAYYVLLKELLQKLRAFLAAAPRDEAAVPALWSRCEWVLQVFGTQEVPSPDPQTPRDRFWA